MRSLCLCFAAALASAAPPDARLVQLVRQVQTEVRPDEAMEYVRRINSTDRLFTFPKFEETAAYLKGEMTRAGLRDVEMLGAPADGATQYGFHTMPRAWDAKSASLQIIEPAVKSGDRLLADYPRIPTSLGMWSGSTPPGGIQAEVVELAAPADAAKTDMRGKMVLTRFNLLGLTESYKHLLVEGGAVGVINGFTENPDLKDGRHWVNFWGDSGWAYTRKSTPLLCYTVTPRQVELLHNLLAKGKVRVKAVADTRYYDGVYAYATGVLPGAEPGEEVLELGHTSEYGANDNATGVASMMEAVAALNRLVQAGKLPRPRRGIRILAMPELYPTMHYLATYPERVRRTVAAICLDTAAGRYELAGTEFGARLTPDVARSYIDALLIRLADAYFPQLLPRRFFHPGPYGTGTDNFLGDPTIGIPTVQMTGGSGVHTHHNSEDTIKRVDPRSLRDLTVLTASFLYAVASAGEADAPWLAEMTADRAYEQCTRVTAALIEHVVSGSVPEGRNRIAYETDREIDAIRSVLRLVPAERRAAVQLQLNPIEAGLRRFAADQSERLQRAGERRRAVAVDLVPDTQLEPASHIVVKRKRFGTLPLDDLSVKQWEGWPYASWDLVPVTALYWCDGKRTLAEVIRLTRMEHDAAGFDFVGYFRFLEKHGYIEIAPPSAGGRTLLLLGDSILDSHQGDQRIEAVLGRKLSGWTVINAAHGGEYIGPKEGEPKGVSEPLFTSETAGRFFDIVRRYPKADAVVVNYAANDSKVYSPAVFRKKLEMLARLIGKHYPGARLIFSTSMYLDPAHSAGYRVDEPKVAGFVNGNSRNAYLEPYNAQIREFCAAHGYGLADTYRRLAAETARGNWDLRVRNGQGSDAGHENDMAWFDNVHPNNDGTGVIAKELADALKAIAQP